MGDPWGTVCRPYSVNPYVAVVCMCSYAAACMFILCV